MHCNGTRPGEVGPCVARLESLGEILELVVGAFGEVSSDLDRVMHWQSQEFSTSPEKVESQ